MMRANPRRQMVSASGAEMTTGRREDFPQRAHRKCRKVSTEYLVPST
jgi:hypothetical protein